MTDKQPEALRLADALEELDAQFSFRGLCGEAAAELRRLHEVNAELVEALEFCAGTSYITDAHDVAKAAIAKATGE
jgi:hypothetical protein